ncbi:hypothetical protein O3G_MSEX006009 [Manduca sexta]|uniref:Uncharacterized protein n=1 Tax=Manduca sexta TaxID=7130 RepID=A0A921Z1Q5_MANSE|nr:hypothetical protein O3G_MSEX006009 [Manduca sexta]
MFEKCMKKMKLNISSLSFRKVILHIGLVYGYYCDLTCNKYVSWLWKIYSLLCFFIILLSGVHSIRNAPKLMWHRLKTFRKTLKKELFQSTLINMDQGETKYQTIKKYITTYKKLSAIIKPTLIPMKAAMLLNFISCFGRLVTILYLLFSGAWVLSNTVSFFSLCS